MSKKLIETKLLEEALQRFASDREWDRFHSPKNLVMALTGEIGELVEIFQWLSDAESFRVTQEPELSIAVQNETADVLIYLVRLSAVLGIDLNEATSRKIEINSRKYPAEPRK